MLELDGGRSAIECRELLERFVLVNGLLEVLGPVWKLAAVAACTSADLAELCGCVGVANGLTLNLR